LKAAVYRKGKPDVVDIEVIDDKGHALEAVAAQAFERMQHAANHDGVTFVVNSAFREHEHQERLYRDYQRKLSVWAVKKEMPKPAPVAPPGFSLHETGQAVDIESAGGTNAAYRWLTEHAAEYGFKRTVPSEAWHWEYRP
jgi:LAS superfamily LD-carboxypeptidase LdcB